MRRARGEFVVRMDCRARYPRGYVARCIAIAEATGAWNVGGTLVPEGRRPLEQAVAAAMDSPFGGIGWSRHGDGAAPVEVDTVYCGTFRRDVFERVGLFDEALPWNEDEELNLRLRRAGGRVLLVPDLRVPYVPNGSLRALVVRYYRYGRGKVSVMRKHRRVVSARSLAPIALVGSLGAVAAASPRSTVARSALAVELALYAASALAFAARSVAGRGAPRYLVPAVAAVFPAMHVPYGVGMAHGLVEEVLLRR